MFLTAFLQLIVHRRMIRECHGLGARHRDIVVLDAVLIVTAVRRDVVDMLAMIVVGIVRLRTS